MQFFIRYPPLPFSKPRYRPQQFRFICSASPPSNLPSLPHLSPPAALSSVRHFLLLSDLHVKRETTSTCVQALQFAHREAKRRNAAIIFLGDFWHARGALPVEPLNRVLTELQTWSVPVIMIPGNHDLISRSGSGVSLVPLATTLGEERCLLITKPSLCLGAMFVPYMHDVKKMRKVLELASKEQIGAVFCHSEVAGARLADRVVAKTDLGVSDFPRDLWVYSGHLHRPHVVGQRIRYVGSPYQVSKSETGQEKSLFVVDRMKAWQVVECIPIHVGPRYWTVKVENGGTDMEQMRRGDKVTVETNGLDEQKVSNLVTQLRKNGVRVDVQMNASGNSSSKQGAQSDDMFSVPEPRISGEKLSNDGLFREYCDIKNLGAPVLATGKEVLAEVAGKSATWQSSISGKDVVIEWEEVKLKDFGSFWGTCTYPLSKRGLVLLTGKCVDEDDVMSGRTNGTGKTTLVMAALWAVTGRTDARPDGSVEKGVSLEMVHDEAMDCSVGVHLTLRGHRVFSEVRDMMTSDERIRGGLNGKTEGDDGLHVKITRKSARPTVSGRNRSYRQELHLEINGIDLTCMDVKETQTRIDRLVNGALLPHTVFFGQHMGAGRGLLDATDRTLKEHLALIFPLDIWKEARKMARSKASQMQDDLTTSEATLEAMYAVVNRLEASKKSSQEQYEAFEVQRKENMSAIDTQILQMLSSYSRWEEDSSIYDDTFPVNSEQLLNRINYQKTALQQLEERSTDSLNTMRARAAAAIATAEASVQSADRFQKQVISLVAKSQEWEVSRTENLRDIEDILRQLQSELDSMEPPEVLSATWKAASEEVRKCEESLEELLRVNMQKDLSHSSHLFSEDIAKVSFVGEKRADFEKERVRLQLSLSDVTDRLNQSQKLYQTTMDGLTSENGQTLVSEVACDTCLRPLDGDQFFEARAKLERQAEELEGAIRKVCVNEEKERKAHELAVRLLNDKIDLERTTIIARKSANSERFAKVRRAREARNSVTNQMQEYKLKLERVRSESNLYFQELSELVPGFSEIEGSVDGKHDMAIHKAEEQVLTCNEELINAKEAYDDVMARVKFAEQKRNGIAIERAAVQSSIEELVQLRSKCLVLENEKQASQAESNPFHETLRLVCADLEAEKANVSAKESDFKHLSAKIDTYKSLDVAFGPRGVPSFVLEEGLMWLEKLTDQYLRQLSNGELLLQIRAFSDYKSSNRTDGENKEVISKRIFVLNPRDHSKIRERSLRQLSGGQRRRCSLAFALAFADLAHERAGFQSSLIVLDEILQSLDEDGRKRISKILPRLMGEEYAARNTVIVVAQDEAPEISELAHGGIDVVVRDVEQSRVVLDNTEHRRP